MASIAPGTSLRPERAVTTGAAGSANVPRQGLRPWLLLYFAAPVTPITDALLACQTDVHKPVPGWVVQGVLCSEVKEETAAGRRGT